jgi:tetratricopeptide (TPR) repeat protein
MAIFHQSYLQDYNLAVVRRANTKPGLRPFKLGAVVMLLIAGLSVLAQVQTAEKPSPAALDFSKEAYVIERLTTKVTAENDGTGTRALSAQIKVISDAGVKAFAVLSFTYTSENEAVDIDYVHVSKPDGTVVKTPDYNIQDMPGEVTRMAPLYSDIHQKHVAVKGLAVGDVLEYLVRFRIVKPLVPGHFWQEYSFAKKAIAQDEELEISVPAAKFLKVVSPEFQPEIKEEGGRRIYRWTHANLQIKENDPNEPPRRIPPNPDVQVTTFASWEDVGRWYGDLQKSQVEVTPAIQSEAAELTKGLTSDDEKIHAIYNFVSLKYHYIGLDFGIGRYQPHTADDVLDNGYGDCKDKHTLLAALLKAVGIGAWPVLIHAERKLDPEVPSPAQFNHVITVVPRGDKLLWLDTTPEVAPYGLLLLNLRDKQALMIPANKPPAIVTTPRDAPFPQDQEFTAEGKLGPDGTFTGHIQQKYRGDAEVLMRTVFRQVPESQWREAVQRFSNAMNFAGDVSNVKMTPPDELDKPFQLSYDYLRKNYSDWDNNQITPPLPLIGLEIAKGSKEIKPVEPVLLGGIGKLAYRAQVELPSGYSPAAPAKSHIEEPFVEYSGETQVKNGVMTTTRELVIKQTEVPLTAWESYSKFGHALADDEFAYIRLAPTPMGWEQENDFRETLKSDPTNQRAAGGLGTLLIRNNQYAEAIKVLEPAAKSALDNATLHYQLGQAYLKTGDKDKALSQLREAVQAEDDDALMLNNVGYALADNKLDLALATDYGEKALAEVDDQVQKAQATDEAGMRVTYLYSLVWDTLGWIYSQQGNVKRAEELIRPAWLLGEQEVVAEHLAEIYQKQGKAQLAAREYEYALDLLSHFSLSGDVVWSTAEYHNRENQLKARYKKLTGKEPELNTTWRLPNNEWTETTAQRLAHSRQVKVANEAKLNGSANFVIRIRPSKVESAHYVSGDGALARLGNKLVEQHYPIEFPPNSDAILVLRLNVDCHPTSPCIATLLTPPPQRP